jgi:hypothetical protein
MYLSHYITNTLTQNISYRSRKATAAAVLTVVFLSPLQSSWTKSEFISLSFFHSKQCYQHIKKICDYLEYVKSDSLFLKFIRLKFSKILGTLQAAGFLKHVLKIPGVKNLKCRNFVVKINRHGQNFQVHFSFTA